MTRDEVLTFLADRQKAWEARDPAALARFHHQECVVESPIFGTVARRDAIEVSYRELFHVFEDWTLTGHEIIVDGDRAVQLFSVHATHSREMFGVSATHRRFEIRGALVITFRDGLIGHERRIYDFTGMLIQLGVIKPKL
jgi:steroid delta-isomerase-like uncharacterized protein